MSNWGGFAETEQAAVAVNPSCFPSWATVITFTAAASSRIPFLNASSEIPDESLIKTTPDWSQVIFLPCGINAFIRG
jgi:hypothetical protein